MNDIVEGASGSIVDNAAVMKELEMSTMVSRREGSFFDGTNTSVESKDIIRSCGAGFRHSWRRGPGN